MQPLFSIYDINKDIYIDGFINFSDLNVLLYKIKKYLSGENSSLELLTLKEFAQIINFIGYELVAHLNPVEV